MKIKVIAEASKLSEKQSRGWGLSVLVDEDILFDTYSKASFYCREVKQSKC